MEEVSIIVIVAISLAYIFDFTNGFHDAANSIATIVATKVLSPRMAVLWAAFFNFIAFFIFGTAVAKTLGKGMVDLNIVTEYMVIAGLLGSISWNVITWFFGIPTSSSHALIGGYAGAAIAKAGFVAIILSGWIKTLIFILIAPLVGLVLGYVLLQVSTRLVANQTPGFVSKWSRIMQLVSSALYSVGHGANDAQKTMGIITSVLFAAGMIEVFEVPYWVAISSSAVIAFGTMFGGWRIVKTMGSKLTKLRPIDGFCAETSSAVSLFIASHFGIPVSTTHVITSSITGVGAAKRASAVRWDVMYKIFTAWIITIPLSAILAGLYYKLIIIFI